MAHKKRLKEVLLLLHMNNNNTAVLGCSISLAHVSGILVHMWLFAGGKHESQLCAASPGRLRCVRAV